MVPGIHKVQGAKTKIPRADRKAIKFDPALVLNDPDAEDRRVNTADPHVDTLAVQDHTDNSKRATTSLNHDEIGSGRRLGSIPR